MAYLDDFLKNSTSSIGQRMGMRNMDYFMQQAGSPPGMRRIISNDPNVIPEQEFAPVQGQLAGIPPEMQQPLQQAQPLQSGVEEPYNLLERVFLAAGGQGEAVKKDKQRYALAQFINDTPVPNNNPLLEAYKQAAIKDPEQFGAAYLKMVTPDMKVQEVDGQLVSYDANNPNSASVVPLGGGKGGTGAPNAKLSKAEQDLRKEVDALSPVKDYRTVRDAYTRVEASAKNPSAAGDLALIFNYMKILDPGSTVREGEFATAQNSGSIPSQIRAQYNKVTAGERLAPEMRTDFVDRAKKLYEAQAENYNQVADQYRGLATEYGYNPDRILKPVKIEKAAAAPKYQEGQQARWPDGSIKTFTQGAWR